MPVSKNFGFSVNAVKNDQFGVARRINRTFNTTNDRQSVPRHGRQPTTTYTYNVFPSTIATAGHASMKVSPVTRSLCLPGNWLVQDYEQLPFDLTPANPLPGPDLRIGGRAGAELQ